MLDNDSANHEVEETTTVDPAPVSVPVDDLPRPPRGRRAATRPAGPPPDAPVATAPVTSEPVATEPAVTEPVATEPAVTEPTAAEPVADGSPTGAVSQPEVPAAEPTETPAAATRSRTPRTRRASSKPATESAATESPATEPSPAEGAEQPAAAPAGDEPAPAQTQAAAGASKAPATRRRGRSRAATTQPTEPDQEASAAIEAALSAAEAAAPKRTRRPTRSTADPAAEVDTQEALASLAAAIAGQGAQVAALEPAAVLPALESAEPGPAPDADEVDQPAADETPAADEVDDQAEVDDEDHDDDQGDDDNGDDETEAGTASASQRRRRRRGGRRRRRGTGSATAEGEAADENEDDSADDAEDGPDETSAEDESADPGVGTTATRRRRRRRRRGDDGTDGDHGDVVVRVREPRRTSTSDEVSGIEGSTRLEAKKQRRREGRAAGRHRAPILTEAEFLARRESVERVMLVRQRDDYTQVAVLEDGVLVEHYVDRSTSTSLIGNIYLGRVQNVLPSMEAVFIDIGRGRNAVLYAGEVDWDAFDVTAESRKVEQVFKSGQSVLVQVSKDPVGAKGARLTGHVSLPGRYVVYSPGGHLSGISRKLPDAERQRLKQILDSVVGEDSSVIVRTAAEGAASEELVADVERLKAQWQVIEKKSKQGSAPQPLYAEPDLTLRIIRDTFTEDFKQLVVAGNGGTDDAYPQISDYLDRVAPHLAERLVQWDPAEGDPFAKFRIDEQISKALERKVFLPSGGSLVIDRTEAMTVIDVNTGKFTGTGGNLEETVTRNNLEAAEEIVRQLRLRDLGGIIVIDFIDMVLPNNRELLLRRLVECLGRDRTRHQVSEVTSLGLVQMTRKRIGTGLGEAFTDVCEHCGGRGYVRHDEPVESQAPADGGERSGGRQAAGNGNTRGRGRTSNRSRAKQEEAPRANQVQPSEAARQAAARLAAASRQHATSSGGDEQSVTEHTDASDAVVVDVSGTEQAPPLIDGGAEATV